MGTVTSLIETASHNGYMKNVGEEMINNPQAFWAVLKIADENGIKNEFDLQSEKDVGKMVESVIAQSIEKNGSLANIIRSVAAIEGRDADYIGSKESLDVARAVIAMAEGKVSAEQRNIISKSRGAVTLLTAIENNNEALGSIKNAAAEEYAKVNAKDSGIGIDKPLNNYPYDVKKVITDYINSTNSTLLEKVKKFRTNKNAEFERINLSNVSEREAADVKELLGIDVSEYRHAINSTSIIHIENRHGENGKHDNTMANPEDVARVEYVLENYDSVEIAKDEKGKEILSKEFKNSHNQPAKMLVYTKKINGTYYGVVAAAENSYKKMWVVTTYISKNKEGITQVLHDELSSLSLTSETPLASLPSNTMVSQDESGVKGEKQERKVGLVMNDAAAELDKGIRANIQTFAERTGSTVVVEHGLVDEKGEAIMGDEKDGVIRINADYADAAHSITVHEFTHRMQNIAPKASKNFKNYVVSKMQNEGTYESAMAKLREDYQGLSDEKLIDELCAETAERLFRDEAELTDFIKKDRTLAEWVKDVWLNVLDMLGRTDERTHAQLMWKKCVNEATRAKDKGVTTGEVRYKREYSFNKQVDDALQNKIQRGYSVYVGKLPKLLEKCGLNPNLPMLMHPSHIRDINHEKSPNNIHYHGISSDIIKQIPELIKYPAMIYDSISEDNSSNSICILTTQCNEDGAPIVIVITNSEQNGKYLDIKMETKKTNTSNHVDTMYGKDGFSYHIDSLIEKDAILYISKGGLNKLLNKKNLRLNSDGKLHLLARLDNLRFYTIIHQSRNVVNMYSMQNGGNNSDSSQKRPGVSEKLDEYINKFGEMEQGKGPRRDVSVPKRTEKNNRVSRTARTAAESLSFSEEFSDDVLESIADEKMSYTPKSDREALNKAYSSMEVMGSEWVEKKVNGAIEAHSLDKDTVALAEVLLQHYDDEGMRKEAQELIVKFAAEGTRMGQSIQAISMLKKLDRNYDLVFIEKIIENLQEDILKKSKGKIFTQFKVSEELKQKLDKARDNDERQKVLEEIYVEIAEQLPKTWVDKWNAWRYFAMLANARTHIRNFVGNAFFMPMICAKNIASKIIEGVGTIASHGKMERSKTFIVPKKYKIFAEQDVKAMRDELTGGGKHNPSDIIKDKQKLFPKGLEWMNNKKFYY